MDILEKQSSTLKKQIEKLKEELIIEQFKIFLDNSNLDDLEQITQLAKNKISYDEKLMDIINNKDEIKIR